MCLQYLTVNQNTYFILKFEFSDIQFEIGNAVFDKSLAGWIKRKLSYYNIVVNLIIG